MKTGKILVQKFNMEEIDLETVLTLNETVQKTLPVNIKAVAIPDTWEFKQVDDRVIYIGLDRKIDLELSNSLFDTVSDALGDGYTIVTNLASGEVIYESR